MLKSFNQNVELTAQGAPFYFPFKVYGENQQFYAHMVGGDLVCFLPDYFNGGFWAIRIKANGTWCCYFSTTFYANLSAAHFIENNSSAIPAGPNAFVLNTGAGQSYYFVLPTAFIPGGYVLVPEITFTPPNPCGAGSLTNTFIDSARGLTAYEFVQSFGDASNIWAAIYSGLSGNSPKLITQGFIGNFPNGQDGFNRLSLQLPPYIYNFSGVSSPTYYYTRGGVAYSGISQSEPQNAYTGQQQIDVIAPGGLECGGSGNAANYVTSNGIYSALQSDYPQIEVTSNVYNCGCSDILGTAVWTMPAPQGMLLSNNQLIGQINLIGMAQQVAAASIGSGGNLIVLGASLGNPVQYQIYNGSIDPALLIPAPIASGRGFHLVNNSRAVSPFGLFRS